MQFISVVIEAPNFGILRRKKPFDSSDTESFVYLLLSKPHMRMDVIPDLAKKEALASSLLFSIDKGSVNFC